MRPSYFPKGLYLIAALGILVNCASENAPKSSLRIVENRIPPLVIPPIPRHLFATREATVATKKPCDPSLKPDKYGYAQPGTCNAVIRNYPPSFATAVTVSVLFSILLLVHIFQAISSRKQSCWIILEGAGMLVISYTLRAVGTRYQQNPYIAMVSDGFLLMSPIVMNAFVYAVFFRMVNFYSPSRAVWGVSPLTINGIITCASIVPFVLQLAASVLVGPLNGIKMQMKAVTIYMFGIGIQLLIMLAVLILIIKFHLAAEARRGLYTLLFSIYSSLAAISIRILFRLVEFSGGFGAENKLVHGEKYFYGFEAVPMLFVLSVWSIVHPGKYLPEDDSELELEWVRKWVGCSLGQKGLDSRGLHHRLDDAGDGEDELKDLVSSDSSCHRESIDF